MLARIPTPELLSLFAGYGYRPVLVEGGFDGEEPMDVHQRMAVRSTAPSMRSARSRSPPAPHGVRSRPVWPMLILRTPKGWTGPKVVDGLPVEGTFRSHQLPLAEVRTNPDHLAQLEAWLRSYRPEELFDAEGRRSGPSTTSPRPANGG